MAKIDREELLCYNPRETSKVSNIPKDLFTQWHLQISNVGLILNKHKKNSYWLRNVIMLFSRPNQSYVRKEKKYTFKLNLFFGHVREFDR